MARPRPTAIGRAALESRPMTADEVADLIERAGIAMVRTLEQRIATPPMRSCVMSAGRVAARYAHLVGCSFREAAEALGQKSTSQTQLWWRRYYPGEAPPRCPWGHARRRVEPTTFRIVGRESRAESVPQFPPGSTCALCAGPCVGALHREPLGRNDALVNVCPRCAIDAPLERDCRRRRSA